MSLTLTQLSLLTMFSYILIFSPHSFLLLLISLLECSLCMIKLFLQPLIFQEGVLSRLSNWVLSIALTSLLVSSSFGCTGFRWDRHWLVINEKGRAYTQRVVPKLACVEVQLPNEAFLEGWEPTNSSYLGKSINLC